MKIHVAARNETAALQFTKNNPDTANVVLHQHVNSLFTLLQTIIDSDVDYALFVHDDVFLPSSINDGVFKLIDKLNTEWPNWGICGNAGITAPTLADGSRICRFLFDPHGGPSLSGFILPAETVDGNTILLNCRALRAAGVRLPSFEGFQFYDIILSIETLAAGLAVLLAPQLAVYHNSSGNQLEFDRTAGSKAFISYLSDRLSNRLVHSINGVLTLPFKGQTHERFDICNKALKNAAVRRPKAKVAFIIRTQFRDVPLLLRAITSTLAFTAAAENASVKTYIITEKSDIDIIKHLPNNVEVITVDCASTSDTRNHLIKCGVNSISEDFVLFLDDDDWLFPNEATYIADLLTCLPSYANLVVDCHSFVEEILIAGESDIRNSTLKPLRRFISKDWPKNFSGNNYTPMCGVFYSRNILSYQPQETYDKIVYYEDYTASLFALLNPKSVFFSVPKLVSGISVRNDKDRIPNTVNVSDRIKWHQSQAELAHHLCVNATNNVALSMGKALGSIDYANHNPWQKYGRLSWLDRKSINTTRFIRGLCSFMIQPKYYVAHLKSIGLAIKSDGVRGAAATVSNMRRR